MRHRGHGAANLGRRRRPSAARGDTAYDLEGFLATYADDAVITSAATGAVLMQGKAAMRDPYGKVFRDYPNNKARIEEK